MRTFKKWPILPVDSTPSQKDAPTGQHQLLPRAINATCRLYWRIRHKFELARRQNIYHEWEGREQ
jgi:hypothetical protein